MKVDGKQPQVPLQDKTIQKGNQKEGLSRELSGLKKSSTVGSVKTDEFAVNKIKEKINSAEDINLDKVNALKARIKSGQYQVDVQKLAENMIKDSQIEDL